MSTEGISERQFETFADEALRKLVHALDEIDTIETDLQMGVLTIDFGDGVKYVINSHRAARQIWMAAERSAWHFDYRPDVSSWRASKDDAELWSTVSAVLSRKLGTSIEIVG